MNADFARKNRKCLLMALLGLITAVEFLENVMFVFASSHIVGGIDAAPREFALVQAAYAIGSMLMIAAQQWLTRHYGYRRYLAGAMLLFMAGACGSAASHHLSMLVIARFIQGLGGGAFFTSSRILVNMIFPVMERPRALKYFMVAIFSASVVAPVSSAWLVENWGWQWVFYGVLPPAALALLGIWTFLPEIGRSVTPVKWAAGPLVFFAIAIICVQLTLSEARYDIFSHPLRLAAFAVLGSSLLGMFFWQQWHHAEPLFNLRELHNPVYLTGLGIYFLHYFISNFSGYLFPIYAERALGLSLMMTGWLNTFAALVSLVIAYAYIRLGRKITNKKPLMVSGALSMAVAALWFSMIPAGANAAQLVLGLVAKGFFAVLLILPVAGMTFRDLGDTRFAHGYQGKNLMRQIAMSFSSAAAAVMLQNRQFTGSHQLSADLVSGNISMVDQQAQLIACEDLYRILAVVALATAAIVLLQKKLK